MGGGGGGGGISENEVRDRLTVDGKLAYFTGAGVGVGGGGISENEVRGQGEGRRQTGLFHGRRKEVISERKVK